MRSSVASAMVALLVTNALLVGDALGQTAPGRPSDPAAAKAEAEGAKAATLRAQGEELYAQGNFRDAVTRLRAAWALRKEAPTVILMGESEVKLGRFADAAGHLAEGLSMLGQGKERARVQALFDQVRPKVGGIELAVNVAGATVIAGSFVGETPIAEIFVEPGELTVTVKKTGYTEQQRRVKTEAGKTVRLEVSLASTGTVVGSAGGLEKVQLSMVPAYVAGGLGLAAVGVGIGLRLSGDAKGVEADDLLEGLSGTAPCSASSPPDACATIKTLRREHDLFVNTSTGLLVGGGALLLGAVAYGAYTNRRNTGVAVVPIGSRSFGGVLVQGSF